MARTYQDIINEIEQLDGCCDIANNYKLNHGTTRLHKSWFTDIALDIAARVREAVGGDPSEWWVEDADGNRVHIGDDVKNSYNCTFYVFGLGVRNGKKTVEYDDGYDDANTVHKVIPESREKIIEDTLNKLDPTGMCRPVGLIESIEQAVDRAMKLEVDE